MSRIFKWLVFSFSHHLIFEGEYLKGKKWNGKGYNDKNEVEYEIKDGNGIITEYGYHFLKFKGEYLNGQKNGKAEEYDNNGKLQFKGYYLNGERHGYGYEVYPPFKGEYLNGKKNGKGIEYYYNLRNDI